MSNLKILRAKQVKELVGYSISSIYRLSSQKQFPKPIKLGDHASGWVASEVNDWIQDRISSRNNLLEELINDKSW